MLLPNVWRGRSFPSPGGQPKDWDEEELIKCGACKTDIQIDPDLSNEYHPVFRRWCGPKDDSLRHLSQPICLATRILETNPALHWMANLLVFDIFQPSYHGRLASPQTALSREKEGLKPLAIVRYEKAPWARSGMHRSLGGVAVLPNSGHHRPQLSSRHDDGWGQGNVGGRGGGSNKSERKDNTNNKKKKKDATESSVDVFQMVQKLQQTNEWEDEIIERWKQEAREKLCALEEHVRWAVDGEIWENAGWSGYTCRVPRSWMPELGKGVDAAGRDKGAVARGDEALRWTRLRDKRIQWKKKRKRKGAEDEEEEEGEVALEEAGAVEGVFTGDLDGEVPTRRECETVEMIREWDAQLRASRDPPSRRSLDVLIMKEYADRLGELEEDGREGDEEWLRTAFMAAVTMLHELAHAVYWSDFRAIDEGLKEPFYGPEYERELGDSFIASIFSGWVPVPIDLGGDESLDTSKKARKKKKKKKKKRPPPNFEAGLAWKHHLTMDHHPVIPKYKAHYSIPVSYLASLFTEANWTTGNPTTTTTTAAILLHPKHLTGILSRALEPDSGPYCVSRRGLHATAALPDARLHGENRVWRRRRARSAAAARAPDFTRSAVEPGLEGGGGGFRIVPTGRATRSRGHGAGGRKRGRMPGESEEEEEKEYGLPASRRKLLGGGKCGDRGGVGGRLASVSPCPPEPLTPLTPHGGDGTGTGTGTGTVGVKELCKSFESPLPPASVEKLLSPWIPGEGGAGC